MYGGHVASYPGPFLVKGPGDKAMWPPYIDGIARSDCHELCSTYFASHLVIKHENYNCVILANFVSQEGMKSMWRGIMEQLIMCTSSELCLHVCCRLATCIINGY